MRIYVYMYVYIYIYIYICAHTYIYTRVLLPYTNTYFSIHIGTCIHVNVLFTADEIVLFIIDAEFVLERQVRRQHLHVCMYVCMYVCLPAIYTRRKLLYVKIRGFVGDREDIIGRRVCVFLYVAEESIR